VLNAVVDMASPRSSQSPFLVTVKPDAFATNPEISVLAILAHEFGHVYWFDSFVPTPGGSFANNFCGGIFYPGANWLRNAVGVPFSNGNRFVFFGDPPSYAGSHVPRLPGSLHSINSSGLWASVLAAFSPVEDFVETFELSVLMNANAGAGLTGAEINSDALVPIAPGSWLAWKIGCFS
jgi:hypothetical protein